jgi:hypothetical protein
MPKMLKFTILVIGLITAGCASDMEIKNVHDNPEPVATTPTPQQDPAVTSPISSEVITGDTPTSEVKHVEEIKLTNLELQKFAYELGFDPKKDLTQDQRQQIVDRKKLRQLERSLDSQKERLQYSKVLPWLVSDTEKIQILSIPSIEGRQVWINKNKVWSRAKDLKNFDDVVESQDIAIGMPADYVKKSWGEPTDIESSGNPIYKNERWQYLKQVSTPQGYKQEKRLVYFEGGRVVGWETE